MDKREEFLKRIRATFKIEAQENIDSMSNILLRLEQNPEDQEKNALFEQLYRSAHSLKGASRAVDLNHIETLCHAAEDVMSAVRNNQIPFTNSVADVLFQTVELIEELLASEEIEPNDVLMTKVYRQKEILSDTEAGLAPIPITPAKKHLAKPPEISEQQQSVQVNQIAETISERKVKPNLKPENSTQTENERSNNTDKIIRISSDKLDSFLVQSEELISLKLSANQRIDLLKSAWENINKWKNDTDELKALILKLKKQSVNSSATLENTVAQITEISENLFEQVKTTEKELSGLLNFSRQEAFSTESKIETLLDEVKKLISIPFSTLLDGFPKMIRSISKELGKEIEWKVEGDSIEVDRRILDKIRNPLLHIIRNSIDYGIENPETRIKKNKNQKGTIHVKIEQIESNKVELVIKDDGAGIDIEKLRSIYAAREGLNPIDAEKITKEALLKTIFLSGVSTSKIVTDLSGRGLGMAIALETIEQLGGTLEVHSEKDKFTLFKCTLPLSVVTFRGIILVVSGKKFIVPTQKVNRVLQIRKDEIKKAGARTTIRIGNEIIPLYWLSEILEINKSSAKEKFFHGIVFELNGEKAGFLIDEVVGEQEVLVKQFNRQLTRLRNVLGASVLGSGEVIPVLNVADIFKSSLSKSVSFQQTEGIDSQKAVTKKSVLIVEDSITSRTLLKNILEAARYDVTLAVDGAEGYAKFKTGNFDVVVSDVEMPRMNGFELTKKIRSGEKDKNIPVVLITSLAKQEDKEKGIDAGANAYIIKSSFDQSNLIEILERLV